MPEDKKQFFFRRMNTKAQDLGIPDEDLRLVVNAEYDAKLGGLQKVRGYEQVGDNLAGLPVNQSITTQAHFDAGTHSSTAATADGDLQVRGGLISQDVRGGFFVVYNDGLRQANMVQKYLAEGPKIKGVSILVEKIGDGADLTGQIWTDGGNNEHDTFLVGFNLAKELFPENVLYRLNVNFSTPLAQTVGNHYWMFMTPTSGDSSNYLKMYASNLSFYDDGFMWNIRTKNLQGHWKLDETSGNRSDTSANAYTLTDLNTVGSSTDAQRGTRSADFEAGNTEGLYIAHASAANLVITGDLTLSAWVKPESIPGPDVSGNQAVVGKFQEGGSQSGYEMGILSTGKPYFYISDDGVEANLTALNGNTTLVAGTWYHLAAVFDAGQSMKLYVNGILDAELTTSVPASIHASTAKFMIGIKDENGSPSYRVPFDGLIDEVQVYNDALTLIEIRSLAKLADATWRFRFNYAATGNWLSATLSAIADLSTITLRHRDLTANYYISQIDITDTSGVAQSSYTTDITSGTETILRSGDFSSGFTYAKANSFKLKITFISGDQEATPIVESINLESPNSILELSPYYRSDGQRSLMAVVGSSIKRFASGLWSNVKTDMTAGVTTGSATFRASGRNSVATGTASSGDLTTLDNTSDTTTGVNAYQGYFLKITGGTGIGQLRVIAYNTGTSTSTTTSSSTSTTTTTSSTTSTTTTTTTT